MSKRLIDLCKKIIRIPTYLPNGQTTMAILLSREFEKIGFTVMVDEFNNVFATKTFTGEGNFLINAHFDTVPPSELWSQNPHVPKIKDNKLYGIGATDDKGAVASIYDAVKNLKYCRFRRLEILLSNHEEKALRVGKNLYNGTTLFLKHHRNKIKSKYGINMEPTFQSGRPRIGIGHTGTISFDLSVYGKQCHSSTLYRGINAISQSCKAIKVLEKENHKKAKNNKSSVGFNVGIICGGTYRNVVPGICEMQCERRILPTEDLTKVERRIRILMNNAGLRYKLKVRKRAFPYSIRNDEDAVKIVSASIKKTLRKTPSLILYSARTDSFLLYKHGGVKTAIFGPGEISQAHIPNEYVSISDLEQASKVLKTMLKGDEF